MFTGNGSYMSIAGNKLQTPFLLHFTFRSKSSTCRWIFWPTFHRGCNERYPPGLLSFLDLFWCPHT